eukprot:TRINITY_DN6992_c0_g1_i2.p1 TRINITY_DN6992_c0_g1~~TRINITY_DN6992_c0_g1_i2.p1  ORF type:complete len:1126 (+),score=290.24 TRINITY_DN6992_c0_g1_i2:70-3447(+)
MSDHLKFLLKAAASPAKKSQSRQADSTSPATLNMPNPPSINLDASDDTHTLVLPAVGEDVITIPLTQSSMSLHLPEASTASSCRSMPMTSIVNLGLPISAEPSTQRILTTNERYIVYSMQGDEGGQIRVIARDSSTRILIKGFQGRIQDLTLSAASPEDFLAAVDETGLVMVVALYFHPADAKIIPRYLLRGRFATAGPSHRLAWGQDHTLLASNQTSMHAILLDQLIGLAAPNEQPEVMGRDAITSLTLQHGHHLLCTTPDGILIGLPSGAVTALHRLADVPPPTCQCQAVAAAAVGPSAVAVYHEDGTLQLKSSLDNSVLQQLSLTQAGRPLPWVSLSSLGSVLLVHARTDSILALHVVGTTDGPRFAAVSMLAAAGVLDVQLDGTQHQNTATEVHVKAVLISALQVSSAILTLRKLSLEDVALQLMQPVSQDTEEQSDSPSDPAVSTLPQVQLQPAPRRRASGLEANSNIIPSVQSSVSSLSTAPAFNAMNDKSIVPSPASVSLPKPTSTSASDANGQQTSPSPPPSSLSASTVSLDVDTLVASLDHAPPKQHASTHDTSLGSVMDVSEDHAQPSADNSTADNSTSTNPLQALLKRLQNQGGDVQAPSQAAAQSVASDHSTSKATQPAVAPAPTTTTPVAAEAPSVADLERQLMSGQAAPVQHPMLQPRNTTAEASSGLPGSLPTIDPESSAHTQPAEPNSTPARTISNESASSLPPLTTPTVPAPPAPGVDEDVLASLQSALETQGQQLQRMSAQLASFEDRVAARVEQRLAQQVDKVIRDNRHGREGYAKVVDEQIRRLIVSMKGDKDGEKQVTKRLDTLNKQIKTLSATVQSMQDAQQSQTQKLVETVSSGKTAAAIANAVKGPLQKGLVSAINRQVVSVSSPAIEALFGKVGELTTQGFSAMVTSVQTQLANQWNEDGVQLRALTRAVEKVVHPLLNNESERLTQCIERLEQQIKHLKQTGGNGVGVKPPTAKMAAPPSPVEGWLKLAKQGKYNECFKQALQAKAPPQLLELCVKLQPSKAVRTPPGLEPGVLCSLISQLASVFHNRPMLVAVQWLTECVLALDTAKVGDKGLMLLRGLYQGLQKQLANPQQQQQLGQQGMQEASYLMQTIQRRLPPQ